MTYAPLSYLVHAHHYAECKLPHSLGGDNDIGWAVAEAERHLADPRVADVLLASNRQELALLLKGEPWVFDEMRRLVLPRHMFHDVREVLAQRGLLQALEMYGIYRKAWQAPSTDQSAPTGTAESELPRPAA